MADKIPSVQALIRHGAAYHEAGHAVVATAFGYEITSIEISDWPRVDYRVPVDEHFPSTPAARMRQLVLALAGLAAEAIHFDQEDRLKASVADVLDALAHEDGDPTSCGITDLLGEDSDQTSICVLLADLPSQEWSCEMEDAMTETRELLEERWSEVDALASELLGAKASL